MDKCVFCDSSEDLNVQMTIPYKENKVTVSVCDKHADDATVKSAKAAYEAKQIKIEEFLEQAKALGIQVQDGPGGLSIVRERVIRQQNSQEPILEDSDEVVDTSKLNRPFRSVGGSTDFGSIEANSSYNITGPDRLPEEVLRGKAKLDVAEGRAGVPVAIPSRRVDGTGTTNIRIIKNENDQNLQRRFKTMAENSMNDRTPNFSQGYNTTTTNCPICYGNGFLKSEVCPKCNGSGIISLY